MYIHVHLTIHIQKHGKKTGCARHKKKAIFVQKTIHVRKKNQNTQYLVHLAIHIQKHEKKTGCASNNKKAKQCCSEDDAPSTFSTFSNDYIHILYKTGTYTVQNQKRNYIIYNSLL